MIFFASSKFNLTLPKEVSFTYFWSRQRLPTCRRWWTLGSQGRQARALTVKQETLQTSTLGGGPKGYSWSMFFFCFEKLVKSIRGSSLAWISWDSKLKILWMVAIIGVEGRFTMSQQENFYNMICKGLRSSRPCHFSMPKPNKFTLMWIPKSLRMLTFGLWLDDVLLYHVLTYPVMTQFTTPQEVEGSYALCWSWRINEQHDPSTVCSLSGSKIKDLTSWTKSWCNRLLQSGVFWSAELVWCKRLQES